MALMSVSQISEISAVLNLAPHCLSSSRCLNGYWGQNAFFFWGGGKGVAMFLVGSCYRNQARPGHVGHLLLMCKFM